MILTRLNVDISGRCCACTWTEENSRIDQVYRSTDKTSICTLVSITKDKETDGKATCRLSKLF